MATLLLIDHLFTTSTTVITTGSNRSAMLGSFYEQFDRLAVEIGNTDITETGDEDL